MDEKQKKGRKKIPSHLLKMKVWAHIEQWKIDALGGRSIVNKMIEIFINSQHQLNNNERQDTDDSTEV